MFLTRRKGQGGQALIMFVLALPMLFGMVGLAFDIGFLEMMQRETQTAADAGAMAGSIALPYGTATAGARAATVLNGFTNGSNGATVTVNNPPLYGPHAGGGPCPSSATNCQYVEVIVNQVAPTFFLRMIKIASTTNVAARAVAANLGQDCIFALDHSASAALNMTILTAINATGCAVVVDSSSSSALSCGFLGSLTASQISVVGGVSSFLCSFSPSPITHATALSDPLASLPTPQTALGTTPCAAQAGTTTISTTGYHLINPATTPCYSVNITTGAGASATVEFEPGRYWSITVADASIGPTLTFDTGLYTIWGSGAAAACILLSPCGFSITGNGTHLNSASGGVTFYMGPTAGSVEVNGFGNTLNLYATGTGTSTDPYPGILFFQDRSNAHEACFGSCPTFSGAVNLMDLEGTTYFPDAKVSFFGCCQISGCNVLVADTIELTLDYFQTTCTSLPGGSAVAHTALTE